MYNMIENLLIDLDDTLLDFKKAERVALTKTLLRCKCDPTEEILCAYHRINASLWRALEEKQITRQALLTERFRQLSQTFSLSLDPEQVQLYYGEYLSMGCFFIPGAEEVLEELSLRYTLYIASNGHVQTQRKRIAGAALSGYFADIFLSEAIGYNKPDPAFFHGCFQHMPGANQHNTVMIGDSLHSDILGGMGVGIPTVWFNPGHAPLPDGIHPDAVIDALAQLPAALRRMETA